MVPEAHTVAAGEDARLTVGIRAEKAPVRGDVTVRVRLEPVDGDPIERTFTVKAEAVTALTRIGASVTDATLTPPTVLVQGEDRAYAHLPRLADFAGEPLPEDGTSGGCATWTVTVPAEGDYTLWAHVQWLDEKGNSFFSSVDDQAETVLGNAGEIGPWIWVPGPMFRLSAGTHTVKIRAREHGSRISAIRLTNLPGDVPGG